MNKTVNTRRIVETGLLIAIGTILSMIIIFDLPYGGSITLCSMLPLVIVSYRYGCKWGFFSGLVYGLFQMFLGAAKGVFKGADFVSVLGVTVLDYLLAFAVIGLAGFMRGKLKNNAAALAVGSLCACILRYLVHVVSGYIFFRSYAEWFFSQDGFTMGQAILNTYSGNTLGLIYSMFYNACFMIPETILTVVVAALMAGMLARMEKEHPVA